MRKRLLLLVILLFISGVQAQGMGMSEFRKVQRQLALADFKALYRQRHLPAHRALSRHRHSRIKKLDHPSLLDHRHHLSRESEDAMQESTMMGDDISQMHFENASMQTQANHDLMTIMNNSDYKRHPDIGVDRGHSEIGDDAGDSREPTPVNTGSEQGMDGSQGQDDAGSNRDQGAGERGSDGGSDGDRGGTGQRGQDPGISQGSEDRGVRQEEDVTSDSQRGENWTQDNDSESQDTRRARERGDSSGALNPDDTRIRPIFADPWRRK